MAKQLAYALINPYTLSKSRTGGVIARYIGRTDLDLVAARMVGPPRQLVEEYAELVRHADPKHVETCNLIADYIMLNYSPDRETGKPRRVMMLLFEGEDAVEKIWKTTGSATSPSVSGQTVRDTYGDYILNAHGVVQYFEPAVLVAPTVKRAAATLRLWARYTGKHGGIIDTAADVPLGGDVQRTLVMLKPDNFRVASLRAGSIIDILSRSGLRIVGAKRFTMSVTQAEEFYGPVRDALASKFADIGSERAAAALTREFGFPVKADDCRALCRALGPSFAATQFDSIVEFMTGCRRSGAQPLPPPARRKVFDVSALMRGLWQHARHPPQAPAPEAAGGTPAAAVARPEGCLALVYSGRDAVRTIRDLLGPTDPRKAQPGSVRREFGSDIMVNAAHASDAPESAAREMKIIGIETDTIKPLVDKYYG